MYVASCVYFFLLFNTRQAPGDRVRCDIEQRNANLMIRSCVIFFHRGLPSAMASPYFRRCAFHVYLNAFACSVVRLQNHKVNASQVGIGLKNLCLRILDHTRNHAHTQTYTYACTYATTSTQYVFLHAAAVALAIGMRT